MKQYRISIIEDDEITALNLQMSLQKQNYEVISVSHNAKDALEALAVSLPDLVFIDISLEDSEDGINLAIELKEKYNLPFIYLSSHSSDDILAKAKLTNPAGYIVKPFHPDSLHAAVQMALLENSSDPQELIKTKSSSMKISFAKNHYLFDVEKNELYFNDVLVPLKKVENAFIKLLVAKLGIIVPFEDLEEYILKETGEVVRVRTLVWRLRNKLATDIIKNATEIGYYIEE